MNHLEGAARGFFSWLHVPAAYQGLALLALAYALAFFVGLLVGRHLQRERPVRSGRMPKKSLPEEDRFQELHQRIRNLADVNNRYLYFMLNIPRVIKRLNATVATNELASSIVQLAREVIHTDSAHLYIYRHDEKRLERVSSITEGPGHSKVTDVVELGRGVVGRAAKDRIIRSREPGEEYTGYGRDYIRPKEEGEDDSGAWMAAPIHFDGRLIGALAIGEVGNPTGDEKNLLKLVSDIAAVTLVNRAFLGEAKQEAMTDPLTGLSNRRHFFHQSREHVEKAIAHGRPISFFILDIDHFKNYNDTNGHDAGDRLLKEISEIILQGSRKSSIVARFGGEEFIVMLPELPKDEAKTYAERLRETVADHPFDHREKQPLGIISISGGIATFPVDGESVREVIRNADAALYRAKEGGRNRVVTHNPYLVLESDEEEGGASTP